MLAQEQTSVDRRVSRFLRFSVLSARHWDWEKPAADTENHGYLCRGGVPGLQDNLKRTDGYSPCPSKGKCTRKHSSLTPRGTQEETVTCSPSPGQARPRAEIGILDVPLWPGVGAHQDDSRSSVAG